MRFLKDTGFVIKRVNLSDSDKFVTIFTLEHGKIDVLAKGVRKINSKRSSHIELLNLVNFQAVKSHKNYVLTEIEVVDSFCEIKEDYGKIGCLFLICELVDKLCPLNAVHMNVFELIKNTVKNIQEEIELTSLVFDFQVKILSLLGFWDDSKKFTSNAQIDRFVENIIERKVKTKAVFRM